MSRRYCLAYVEGDKMRAMEGDPARERPGVATWETWEIEQVCALESRSYLVLGRDESGTHEPHAQGEQMLLIVDGSRSERVIGPKASEYERHTDAGRLPLYSWRIDRIWPADHARAYALFSRGPIAAPIVTGSVEIALESLPHGMIPASGLVVWSWSSIASAAPPSTARRTLAAPRQSAPPSAPAPSTVPSAPPSSAPRSGPRASFASNKSPAPR